MGMLYVETASLVRKYAPLEKHLRDSPCFAGTVTLSFPDLERVLGFPLPPSAHQHPAWWSNTNSHSQATAWVDAGYEVDGFQLGGWVRFRRIRPEFAENISHLPGCQRTVAPAAQPQPVTQRSRSGSTPQPYIQGETVALVSCVKTKRSTPSAARELYISAWFRKANAYVDSLGIPWYILSAEYGLVHPEQVLVPYERTLKNMPVRERREWATRVMNQFQVMAPNVHKCVIIAGKDYREFLLPQLEKAGINTEVPMYGLTQGRQLNWLDSH